LPKWPDLDQDESVLFEVQLVLVVDFLDAALLKTDFNASIFAMHNNNYSHQASSKAAVVP